MEKIILKSNFSLHQKLVLILLFIVTFIIGIVMFTALIMGWTKEVKLGIVDYVMFFFLPLSFLALLHLFSKNGIIIDGNKLFNSKFIFGFPWSKKQADIKGITDISILSFKGNQKYMFAFAANPDKGYSVSINKVYLLNEKHTIKNLLFTTRDRELAEKTIEKINNTFNFNYCKYNPRFNTRRRGRR